MIRHRIHATAATGLAAGCLLVGASVAQAATLIPTDVIPNPRAGALEFGSPTWQLSGGAASKLKSGGVALKGLGSGDDGTDVKGSKIEFEAAADDKTLDPSTKQLPAMDPTTMKGTMVLLNGLSIKGRSHTVKLTSITLQPGLEKKVVAKLGSKLVELGSLKGGSAKFSHVAQGDLTG
ncbi:MAG: hypothetical protein REI11_19910, partial [Patulibacter sp.]|nr:hypothetical protein [Patulibacter sp.]